MRHPRRGTFPLWCAHGGRKGSARRSPFDFSVCNTPVCQCRSMPAFRFARRAVRSGRGWMELRRASTRPLHRLPPLVAASTPRSESIHPASLWVPCRTTRTVPASPVMSAAYNTTAAVVRARPHCQLEGTASTTVRARVGADRWMKFEQPEPIRFAQNLSNSHANLPMRNEG